MAVKHDCMYCCFRTAALRLELLTPVETLAVLPGHMSTVAPPGACRGTDSEESIGFGTVSGERLVVFPIVVVSNPGHNILACSNTLISKIKGQLVQFQDT